VAVLYNFKVNEIMEFVGSRKRVHPTLVWSGVDFLRNFGNCYADVIYIEERKSLVCIINFDLFSPIE
jgi:hypothetical protein